MAYNITLGGRQVLRAAATAINTSFDAAPTAIRVNGWNQLVLMCDLTLATATSVEIQIEIANPAPLPGGQLDPDPVAADWYSLAYVDTAAASGTGGTKTVPTRLREYSLVATGKYALELPISARWLRVKAKTTAGPGATTLAIVGQQGTA